MKYKAKIAVALKADALAPLLLPLLKTFFTNIFSVTAWSATWFSSYLKMAAFSYEVTARNYRERNHANRVDVIYPLEDVRKKSIVKCQFTIVWNKFWVNNSFYERKQPELWREESFLLHHDNTPFTIQFVRANFLWRTPWLPSPSLFAWFSLLRLQSVSSYENEIKKPSFWNVWSDSKGISGNISGYHRKWI